MIEHEKLESVQDFMDLYRKRERLKHFTKAATTMWVFFLGEFSQKDFPETAIFSNSQLEQAACVSKQYIFSVLDELKDRGMIEYTKCRKNCSSNYTEVRIVKGLKDKMEGVR